MPFKGGGLTLNGKCHYKNSYFFLKASQREGVKRRTLYGQADRKRRAPPLPSLQAAFCDFFDPISLCMYLETDILQEKGNFHATSTGIYKNFTRKRQFSCHYYWNPKFLLSLLLPSGWSFARGQPLILTTTKRAWECIFETLQNEIKGVLSVIRNKCQWKKINIFSTAGALVVVTV